MTPYRQCWKAARPGPIRPRGASSRKVSMNHETERELPSGAMPLWGWGSRGSAVKLWHLPWPHPPGAGLARKSDRTISPVQSKPLGAVGARRLRMQRQYLPQPLRRRACREFRSARCLFLGFLPIPAHLPTRARTELPPAGRSSWFCTAPATLRISNSEPVTCWSPWNRGKREEFRNCCQREAAN